MNYTSDEFSSIGSSTGESENITICVSICVVALNRKRSNGSNKDILKKTPGE